jgi:hypothetical protein
LQHIIVPVSRNAKSLPSQYRVASLIALRVCVLAAVDLDHKASLKAHKVQNEILKRNLAPKFYFLEPAVTQYSPHRGFGISRVATHRSRILANAPGY